MLLVLITVFIIGLDRLLTCYIYLLWIKLNIAVD